MKIKSLSLLILATAILVTGCARKYPFVPEIMYGNYDNLRTTTEYTQNKLAETAASVSTSLEQLAEIERAIHPHAKMPPPPNPHSIGMGQYVSIDWVGPIDQLLRRLAAASHYHVKILGREPAVPVIVSIRVKNKPLADVVRNIGFQAQKQAILAIYPHSKIVELRYLRP
jgi:defect-in-organelle-trafficking protein DotD